MLDHISVLILFKKQQTAGSVNRYTGLPQQIRVWFNLVLLEILRV